MERKQKRLVFLDTHVLIWLYDALIDRFSKKAKHLINKNPVLISPFVKLEIQYLYESNKIKVQPVPVIATLENSMGLYISQTPLKNIIDVALTLDWTRDPFDRLLTAEAIVNNAYFITKDEDILKNYSFSVW